MGRKRVEVSKMAWKHLISEGFNEIGEVDIRIGIVNKLMTDFAIAYHNEMIENNKQNN